MHKVYKENQNAYAGKHNLQCIVKTDRNLVEAKEANWNGYVERCHSQSKKENTSLDKPWILSHLQVLLMYFESWKFSVSIRISGNEATTRI